MIVQQKSLVSVITPFLNGGTWLREAVQSVLDQTYTNWELVLVDDGSVSEVSEMARALSVEYNGKVIYAEHLEHANQGVAASRNLGIRKSKGELIAFLDSDDCWLPQKLHQQIEIFNNYPAIGMLAEASRYWFSWDNPSQKDVVIKVGTEGGRIYHPPELIYSLYPLGKGAAPCPSGIILRKDALIRSGGFEESFTGPNQVYEDQAFLCKIYLNEIVFVSEEANNLYRQRAGSLMQSIMQEKKYRKVRQYFIRWLKTYLQNNRIRNAKLDRLVSKVDLKTRWPYIFAFMRKCRSIVYRYIHPKTIS